jgi:site-specific DNA recombinase
LSKAPEFRWEASNEFAASCNASGTEGFAVRFLPPPGTRVVIYARYSTKHQDFRSIEGQVALCREYAEKHGWVVVKVYADPERSGTTLEGRIEFIQMMSDARTGKFELVLVEDIDRASRDAADTHTFAKTLDELDIVLCSVSNGVTSNMELTFKAAQNSEYAKQSREKTKRGQRLTVENGRISGSIAYGFRKVHTIGADGKPVNGIWEIDPTRIWVIRRIFAEYFAGVSTHAICTALNNEGIPSPRGKLWSPGILVGSGPYSSGILRNRLYKGEYIWPRTQRKRREGKMIVKPTAASARKVYYHPELAAIEAELFEHVQDRLERSGQKPLNERRKAEYLFTGKYRCGVCGESYMVMNGRLACSGRVHKGICTNSRRVEREVVEERVISRIAEHLLAPELLEPCLAEYRAEAERAMAEYEARSSRSKLRLSELDRTIATLFNQLGSPEASAYVTQAIMRQLDMLEAERQRLEREMKDKPPTPGPALEAGAITETLKVRFRALCAMLGSQDRAAAQSVEVLRSLIERIVLEPVPDTAVDGRGAGPLRITVYGRLAELIELAEIPADRIIQPHPRTTTWLAGSVVGFRFSFTIPYENPRSNQTLADLPVVAQALDEQWKPVPKSALVEALAKGGTTSDPGRVRKLEARVRYALEHLERMGEVRAIQAGPQSGWVWNHYGLTDAEWKAQARSPEPEQLLRRRATPPGAVVVVIGASGGL